MLFIGGGGGIDRYKQISKQVDRKERQTGRQVENFNFQESKIIIEDKKNLTLKKMQIEKNQTKITFHKSFRQITNQIDRRITLNRIRR